MLKSILIWYSPWLRCVHIFLYEGIVYTLSIWPDVLIQNQAPCPLHVAENICSASWLRTESLIIKITLKCRHASQTIYVFIETFSENTGNKLFKKQNSFKSLFNYRAGKIRNFSIPFLWICKKYQTLFITESWLCIRIDDFHHLFPKEPKSRMSDKIQCFVKSIC